MGLIEFVKAFRNTSFVGLQEADLDIFIVVLGAGKFNQAYL
jgi:hypothetical protein